jgi:hypothetical protein
MIVEATLAQFHGSRLDRLADRTIKRAKSNVGTSRRDLLQGESTKQAHGKTLVADFKDPERALRLRAPIAIGWHFHGAKSVMLDA